MLTIKAIFLIPVLLLSLLSESRVNSKSFNYFIPATKSIVPGEDMTWVVRYSFIKIGEIRIRVVNKIELNGEYYYNTICNIDSYDLPFVKLHQVYESKVNQDFFSNYFRGIVKYDDYSTFTEYLFDYKNKVINIKQGKQRPYELWHDSTAVTDTLMQDGLSIFFYARMNAGKKNSVSLPCFVNEKKVYTRVNFYEENYPIKVENVKYDVDCVYINGDTDFVSVFGLTGKFEGWFSNDEASVPIKANMKVIIGNVTIELKKWKRGQWNPPKYMN